MLRRDYTPVASLCATWHSVGVKALVALTLALALALPAAARVEASTAKRTAVLRLATAHPVAFRGSRFLAGERVGVVVSQRRACGRGR